ncbi:hypothetical protein [Paenibacillus sp. 1001270B_150601_E10]|uniref:hypothetical protein n=1 Tax=Paenibacillus sp. 1001270B_150601_E10 TaxID=2787079 RepID=UPI00189DBAD6|nr:hypothetical protein [Paenibacillus sp. 1001270B_150601_E10]
MSKQSFIYGIMNTTIFMPYLIFVLMGDHYSSVLSGWLPLLLFYTFKYTGTYLLNTFRLQLQSRNLLLQLLIVSIIGCLCGLLTPLASSWLDGSAVLLGISSGLLLPLYTTIQYHQRYLHHQRMSGKQYLWAFISMLLLLFIMLVVLRSPYPYVVFIIYGSIFLYSYIELRKLPEFEVESKGGFRFNRYSLFAFLSLSILLFASKGIRQTLDTTFAELLMVGLIISLLLLFMLLRKHKVMFKLSAGIRYFAFVHGMTMNFYVLHSTIWTISKDDNSFLIYGVYLPYFIGNIASLLLGGKLLRSVDRLYVMPILAAGSILGLIMTLFTTTLSIGGFVIGLCTSMLGVLLNRKAYDTCSEDRDSSILARSRWSMLGSTVNQIAMMTLLIVLGLIHRLPIHDAVLDASGKIVHHQESLTDTLYLTGIIVVCGISLLYAYGIWKFIKDKDERRRQALEEER